MLTVGVVTFLLLVGRCYCLDWPLVGNLDSLAPSSAVSPQPSDTVSDVPSSAPTGANLPTRRTEEEERINVLIITADQLRYDALRFVQESMDVYKNKLKIQTPHLDKLASQGVWFRNAYAQAASCVPARATLRSGCTMERTGVKSNRQLKPKGGKSKSLKSMKRVEDIRTYDQLFSHVGYQVESYGKLHIPRRWFFDHWDSEVLAITYDSFSVDLKYPTSEMSRTPGSQYKRQVKAWAEADGRKKVFLDGQQASGRSEWPYTPIRLDARYGATKLIPKTPEFATMGVDSLPSNYSQTTYTGLQGLLSLRRLAQGDKPWVVTVSFENPHPPNIVSREFASMYLGDMQRILVPPSMHIPIDNKYYAEKQVKGRKRGLRKEAWVQEWTAIYYGMVTQVDRWVGTLLQELDDLQISNRTLVVFTSDHGEFLGAHGLEGKAGVFEEAIRVPLVMRLPGQIAARTMVDRPVSHLDVLATMLDYAGLSKLDRSDGTSLRPTVDEAALPREYEDRYAVAERNGGDGGKEVPSFMVRHGRFKLMVINVAKSPEQDLMFDLQNDPFEMTNLLHRTKTSDRFIGKAEHLKCLLLEWLRRNDRAEGFYSRGGRGRGTISQISRRRTWPAVNQWVSDTRLEFDSPVFDDGKWRSNAWLYIGRTTKGRLVVKDVSLAGKGKQFFTVSQRKGVIRTDQHMRIKVSFASSERIDPKQLKVRLILKTNVRRRVLVKLLPWKK